MSKTKNRTGSELEHLRGENRRLKSQLRYYKKRCKELERSQNYFQNIDPTMPDDDDGIDQEFATETCPDCGKGHIYEVDLKYIVVKKCDICSYTERRSASGKKKEEGI